MDKRKITKNKLEFLKKELRFYTSRNIISVDQKETILNLYDVKGGLNFVRVLLIVGAFLVGLGVLSFIASNWKVIGKVYKFAIILLACGGTYFTGYVLEKEYPKTGRSLIYLSLLIYGAGIFLVGQMFNYGGHFTKAFLLWAIGILPTAVLIRDKLIFIFSHGLTLVYLNGYLRLREFPAVLVLLIVLFYYFNKYFDYSKTVTFFTNLISINFLVYICNRYEVEEVYTLLIFFTIGLLMYYLPVNFNEGVFRVQGNIVFGISGLLLTFRGVWNDLSFISNPEAISIVFGILYLVFLLLLTRKGNLISLVFICITIFRYYSDTMYDFMPKSLFFIVGGLILLGFGYYFERIRRVKGGATNE